MRRYGIEKPYEQLKDLTRGKGGITQPRWRPYPEPGDSGRRKTRLLALSPATYLGKAAELAQAHLSAKYTLHHANAFPESVFILPVTA